MQKMNVNGISLAYLRSGQGLPLVLVHGFPLDHTCWELLSPKLESTFDVLMPDLRGFGLSDVPEGDCTIQQMADDLSALLNGLNIQKTIIVGHSMGGYVALAFAHAYPGMVLGLGLLGSQAAPDSPERKAGRYATAEQVAVVGARVVVDMAEKLSASPRFVPFLRETILRQPPGGIIGALKAMAGRADAAQFVASFNFPVVIVHGMADALIPVERSREIKKLLPHAVLIELPGVGHSPMLDAPIETARAISSLRQ
jgi:3-oxoadipate enol-lactonase